MHAEPHMTYQHMRYVDVDKSVFLPSMHAVHHEATRSFGETQHHAAGSLGEMEHYGLIMQVAYILVGPLACS